MSKNDLTLLATCGDLEQHSSAVGALAESLVHAVVALSLKLEEVVLLELGDAGVDKGVGEGGAVVVEEVVQVVVLLESILGDERAKLPELSLDEVLGVGGEPMNLLAGGLEVTGKVELEVELVDGRGSLVDTSDDGVTPAHQGNLLVVIERSNVDLV